MGQCLIDLKGLGSFWTSESREQGVCEGYDSSPVKYLAYGEHQLGMMYVQLL